MVAWWTGGAWVLYFADAPTLVKDLATFQAPLIAYVFIGLLTFTTYSLAGWMREQVCVYMCPWPRIQAALTDEYALNVTYRYDRGEPRASLKKAAALHAARAAGRRLHRLPAMRACLSDRRRYPRRPQSRLHPVRPVHRCLRRGDGEDRPADSPHRLRHRHQHQTPPARAKADLPDRAQPHGALCRDHRRGRRGHDLRAWRRGSNDDVSVLHDRNPLFVRLSDGSLRNAFTVRILNKSLEPKAFVLKVSGLPDADVDVIGSSALFGRQSGHRGRPRSDRAKCAFWSRPRSADRAGSLDPDHLHHRAQDGRIGGERRRSFLRTVRRSMSERPFRQRYARSARFRQRRSEAAGNHRPDGLGLMVAFFGVVIGVNGLMAHEALSTFGGVETDSAYQAGQMFERDVAMAKAQDARHWQVDAKVTAAARRARAPRHRRARRVRRAARRS